MVGVDMNNDLMKITNDIAFASKQEVAKMILKVFSAVTPKFYRGLTSESLKMELAGIELVIADIDSQTLAEMCKRAIKSYAIARSKDSNTYFDINYILSFYKESFDFVHSINVPLSRSAEEIEDYYDEVTNIKWQKWREKNGEIVETASFVKDTKISHKYSLKDYERMFTDLDNIEF